MLIALFAHGIIRCMRRNDITFNFLAPRSASVARKRGSSRQKFLDTHLSVIDLIWCHATVAARTFDAVMILIDAFYRALMMSMRACAILATLFFAITIHIPLLLLRFVCRVVYDRLEHVLQEITESWEDVHINARRRMPRPIHFAPAKVPRIRIPSFQFHLPSLQIPSFQLPRFSLTPGWHAHVVSFFLIAFLLTSPFIVFGSLDSLYEVRNKTLSYGKSGFDHFSVATAALANSDARTAEAEFADSIRGFSQAQKSLRSAGDHVLAIARIIPIYGKKLKDAEALIEIGTQLASAGVQSADVLAAVSAPGAFSPDRIGETLGFAKKAVRTIADTLSAVESKLVSVDSESLPEEYRSNFVYARDMSARILSSINTVRKVLDLSEYALGISSDRRYLIIMQNDREVRATGGFMGSYALLDVKSGAIKNLEIPGGGTYDVQGQLRTVLAAPWPLRIINSRWEFQDANWYPDFPASAKKIMWFYENAGGPTVDGVIAINASVAERILDIIGPLEHPSFAKPISADNFIDITQIQTELTYDKKKNKPKEFLGSFIEMVKQKIESEPEQYNGEILTLLVDSLLSKDIQMYFREEASQQILHSLQLDNRIPDVKSDYLMIVDTNIGGGKTDGVMKSDASYLISADESGSLTASLTIRRSHHGEEGDYFTGRKNIDHVRIYVPQGAELLSAAGFTPPPRTEFENPPASAMRDSDLEGNEIQVRVDDQSGTVIYDSFGKTVFSNWMQTPVGETTRATITYRLPLRLPEFKRGERIPYNLFADRQSGSSIDSFRFEARFPVNGNIELISPVSEVFRDGIIRYDLTPFLASTPIGLVYSPL